MAELFVGLISGTSRDGIEAALAGPSGTRPWAVHAHLHHPYPPDVAADLERLSLAGHGAFMDIGRLDAAIGEAFADAATRLLRREGLKATNVRAIGSHGQTLFHAPGANPAFTWQIGDPFRIAERTGIDTVAWFRQRDVAAGGEGAPLASGFHAACFSDPQTDRAVVNIGGISNITWLRPGFPTEGYDCGPGNTLMDLWVRERLGVPFDANGEWSASGRVIDTLLADLRSDPFLSTPAPKTTGPEHFSREWLKERIARSAVNSPGQDVQATLTEFTASVIADAVIGARTGAGVCEVLICGGGAFNGDLMRRLSQRLTGVSVSDTGRLGVPPDQVEAAAFAWLAAQTLTGRAGNLPEVTGARGPRILGCVIPGRLPG